MKKSLICSWIANCDYPIWRYWIQKYGVDFFDEIIIYWDINFRYPFYNAFIQSDLSRFPKIKFIDKVEGTTNDWRHTATTELLKYATGDWICSIEQDWFCRDWPNFFKWVTQYMDLADLFGWMNPTNAPYIHPACFFIKRELLEKTSKDFSAHPEINGSDHFAQITYDANKLNARIRNLPLVMEVIPESDCFHLGSVNYNYLNGLDNPSLELHRGAIFYIYNYFSMKLDIAQSSGFMDIMLRMDNKLKAKYGEINPEQNSWTKFFTL